MLRKCVMLYFSLPETRLKVRSSLKTSSSCIVTSSQPICRESYYNGSSLPLFPCHWLVPQNSKPQGLPLGWLVQEFRKCNEDVGTKSNKETYMSANYLEINLSRKKHQTRTVHYISKLPCNSFCRFS